MPNLNDSRPASGWFRAGVAPKWADKLLLALATYVTAGVVSMLTDLGGSVIEHYFGLLCDGPANFVAFVVSAAAARRTPAGPAKAAWSWLAAALGLYFVGNSIAMGSWLVGLDPFPGPADTFFFAFYFALIVASLYFIRAAAVRVSWPQLLLDATIFVVGFGAFFWFLVIRPDSGSTEMDFVKHAISQAYAGLDCLVLLTLGVLLLAGTASDGGRRIPLLLVVGFTTMFMADIVWSLAKVRGYYLPGGFQDVLYLSCYLPMAAAAREQLCDATSAVPPTSKNADSLARSLPYAAMLSAFLVLAYFTRADIGGPATVMTMIVFTLTLLLMVRQSIMLRGDALMRERQAARVVEDRYASLIANASDVIMIVTTEGIVRFTSPAVERTLGVPAEELLGKNIVELWSGDECARLKQFLTDIESTARGVVGPVEIGLDRPGGRLVMEIVGSNLTDDEAVNGLALNVRDITERHALQEQLRQLAFHDPLTLLANRNLFRDRVQHALTLTRRDGTWVAVMFLDVDNFKTINDSLGHDSGDRLLQAVAQRLVKSTRSADTVARLGGDEFAVLLEGVGTPADVTELAGTLVEALQQPFSLGVSSVNVAASIGVALSANYMDAEALLSNADIAMYHAKAAGKNRFVTFRPEMQEVLHERLQLEADLVNAFERQEFFIQYQPIVDLGTRSLLGVEALVRWRHPQWGVLLPGRFVQIAEECGQIIKLGRWVLLEACRELRAWRGSVAGGDGLRVAVNISGRHLQHGNLAGDVAHALEAAGLEPGNLVIELTESSMMYNTENNLEQLHQLKRLGVRLAIDDFGTGYSSLSYLHRFPIDILKIDQSFVSGLMTSDNSPELARAVITLGDSLGLDTVAEGIEYESQVGALLDLGCVAGQGLLFSGADSLARLSTSFFVERRNALWSQQATPASLSATGRFAALRVGKRRA